MATDVFYITLRILSIVAVNVNIVVNKGNVFLSGEAYGSGGCIQSSNLIHISLKFMTNFLCDMSNGNPIKQS